MLDMIIARASLTFQGPGLKVKVTGFFLEKTLPTFIDGF